MAGARGFSPSTLEGFSTLNPHVSCGWSRCSSSFIRLSLYHIARKMVDNQQTRHNHATHSWFAMNEINMKIILCGVREKKFFLVTMQLSNYEKWDDQIKKDIRIYWNNSNGSRCKYFSKTINKVLFQYGCRENIWNSRLLPMIAASTKRLSRLQTIMLTPRGVGWYLWRGPPRGGWGAIGGGGTLRW